MRLKQTISISKKDAKNGRNCKSKATAFMPGQWEFQVGSGDPLKMSDDLIIARYLLFRQGENYNINVSLDPKPVRGACLYLIFSGCLCMGHAAL